MFSISSGHPFQFSSISSSNNNNELVEISPAQRLFNALVSKGVIDQEGRLIKPKEDAYIDAQKFHEFVQKFWETDKVVRIPELGIEFKINLQNLFEYLVQIEPAFSIDLIEEEALRALGFEAVNQLYAHWGIDLVEVCGPEYAKQLEEELNQPITLFDLTYSIAKNDHEIVNRLIRGVLDFIGSRISKDKIKILENYLTSKTQTHYKEWLDSDRHTDLIPGIAIKECAIVNNITYSKPSTLHCGGGLAFNVDDQINIRIGFWEFANFLRSSYRLKKVRLPFVKTTSKEETQVNLQNYYEFYLSGLINLTCRKRISSDTYALSSYHSDRLILNTLKGETSCYRSDQSALIRWRVTKSNTSKNLTEGTSLGIWLNSLKSKTMTDKEFLVLVLNSCELFLETITSLDLKDLITITSEKWQNIAKEDDGSFLFPLAKLLLEGVPYEVIASHLNLFAKKYGQELRHPPIKVWRSETCCPRGYKKLTQLEISEDNFPIFLNLDDQENLLSIFDYSLLPKNKNLSLLVNRLINNKNVDEEISFENIHFENMERQFDHLFDQFLVYVSNFPQNTNIFAKQLCLILNSKNNLLSDNEKLSLIDLAKKLEMEKIDEPEKIISLFLDFFGKCQNKIFSQIIYKFYKNSNSLKLRIEAIKSLVDNNLLKAIKAYVKLKKENPAQLKNHADLNDVLKVIMIFLKKNPTRTEFFDLLSNEFEFILNENSKIGENKTNWLQKQINKSTPPKVTILKNPRAEASIHHNARAQVTAYEKETLSSQDSEAKVKSINEYLEKLNQILTHTSSKWIKEYRKLLQNFHESQLLKNSKNLWWEKFIFPALEKVKNETDEHGCYIYIHVINSLAAYQPDQVTFKQICESFIDFIKQTDKNITFPSIFKEKILKNIDNLMGKMIENGLFLQVVDLAYEVGIRDNLKASDPLLEGFLHALDKSPEYLNKIHELMVQNSLLKGWSKQEKMPLLLSRLGQALAKQHSPIAFDYFDRCKDISEEFEKEMLFLSIHLNQPIRLLEILKNSNNLLDNPLFDKIIEYINNNFNEKNIEILNQITLKQNLSPLKLEKIENILKKVDSSSPYFDKFLACKLNLLNYMQENPNQEISTPQKREKLLIDLSSLIKFTNNKKIINIYFKILLFQIETLDNANAELVWKNFIEKLNFLELKNLIKLLKNYTSISAFNLDHKDVYKNFICLFKACEHYVSHNRNEKIDPIFYSSLEKICNFINKNGKIFYYFQIKIIYINILAMNPKSQKNAVTLLLDLLETSFSKKYKENQSLINTHFKAGEKYYNSSNHEELEKLLNFLTENLTKNIMGWTDDLIHYFKKILKNINNKNISLSDITNIEKHTAVDFNHEIFLSLSKKFFEIRGQEKNSLVKNIVLKLLSLKPQNEKDAKKINEIINKYRIKDLLMELIFADPLSQAIETFHVVCDSKYFLNEKERENLKQPFVDLYYTNILNKNIVSLENEKIPKEIKDFFEITEKVLGDFNQFEKSYPQITKTLIHILINWLINNSIEYSHFNKVLEDIFKVSPIFYKTKTDTVILDPKFYPFIDLCIDLNNRIKSGAFDKFIKYIANIINLAMKEPRNFNSEFYACVAKIGILIFEIKEYDKNSAFENEFNKDLDIFKEFLLDKTDKPKICELFFHLLKPPKTPSRNIIISSKSEVDIVNTLLEFLNEYPSSFSVRLAFLFTSIHFEDSNQKIRLLIPLIKKMIAINEEKNCNLYSLINYVIFPILNSIFDDRLKNLKTQINELFNDNLSFYEAKLDSELNFQNSMNIIFDLKDILQSCHGHLDFYKFQKIMNRYYHFCSRFLEKQNQIIPMIASTFITCLFSKNFSKNDQEIEQLSILNNWFKFLYNQFPKNKDFILSLLKETLVQGYYKKNRTKYEEILRFFQDN